MNETCRSRFLVWLRTGLIHLSSRIHWVDQSGWVDSYGPSPWDAIVSDARIGQLKDLRNVSITNQTEHVDQRR